MISVLDKRWLAMGWRVMDPADSEPMALAWIEVLDRESVPWQHYEELSRRCTQLRANRLTAGLKCDDFTAEMMLACWHNLRDELHERLVSEGRSLTANAAAACEMCHGTGWKSMESGGYAGVVRCGHE